MKNWKDHSFRTIPKYESSEEIYLQAPHWEKIEIEKIENVKIYFCFAKIYNAIQSVHLHK